MKVISNIFKIIGGLILFFLLNNVIFFIVQLMGIKTPIVALTMYSLVGICIILILIKLFKFKLDLHTKLKHFNFLEILKLIVFFCIVINIFGFILIMLELNFFNDLYVKFLKNISELTKDINGINSIIAILLFVVITPIYEELIFRKFTIDLLRKNGEMTYFGIILFSGILFGLVHAYPISKVLFATLLGIASAIIYVITDFKIIYSILMHFIYNLVPSISEGIMKYVLKMENVTLDNSKEVIICYAIMLVFLALVYLLLSFSKKGRSLKEILTTIREKIKEQ